MHLQIRSHIKALPCTLLTSSFLYIYSFLSVPVFSAVTEPQALRDNRAATRGRARTTISGSGTFRPTPMKRCRRPVSASGCDAVGRSPLFAGGVRPQLDTAPVGKVGFYRSRSRRPAHGGERYVARRGRLGRQPTLLPRGTRRRRPDIGGRLIDLR